MNDAAVKALEQALQKLRAARVRLMKLEEQPEYQNPAITEIGAAIADAHTLVTDAMLQLR